MTFRINLITLNLNVLCGKLAFYDSFLSNQYMKQKVLKILFILLLFFNVLRPIEIIMFNSGKTLYLEFVID